MLLYMYTYGTRTQHLPTPSRAVRGKLGAQAINEYERHHMCTDELGSKNDDT